MWTFIFQNSKINPIERLRPNKTNDLVIMKGNLRMKRFINIHTILLLVFVVTIGGLVYRFYNWGVKVDPNQIETGEERPDNLDMFLPLVDEDGNIISDRDDETTIVCFGNAPFADDRNSSDNLANMIAEKTGATVYNCSISGSYLAAGHHTIEPDVYPLDAYNFYWLTQLATKNNIYSRCADAAAVLGDAAPEEASTVYDTLWKLDFTKVDVVAIMYDASDYLAGNEMYSDENDTDIEQFTGNLEAGIELFQTNYPWIRIIVMSPTYAYAVDENGNYVSSDKYTYGWDVLSTYAIKQQESCSRRSVTFIDHIYGTVNEDNADQYLTDNLHLNKAGRELVADRFADALYYYDE